MTSAPAAPEWLSARAAAARLGISRTHLYRLIQAGRLDVDDSGDLLRVAGASIERYLAEQRPVGAQLAPIGAWAVLALASGDAAFRGHVADRLSDRDRARARGRLTKRGFLTLAPRLLERATTRRFAAAAGESLATLLEDARLVLAGTSAARLHGWQLPAGDWPIEGYVREEDLVRLVEQYELDRVGEADVGDVMLRSIPAPWPFPPHARLAPALVAALDLSESGDASLQELGEAQLALLAPDPLDAVSWQRRPHRLASVRPIVPTGSARRPALPTRVGPLDAAPELWDDRAERDARHLVALLFVEAQPVRRATLGESLRISPARLERACAFLRALPPHGLALVEDADRLGLATAPDCAAVVEQHLKVQRPEPLSQAALEALAVVAYEQPVSRADISSIRGTDSTGLVDTLLARGLIAVDPRFGGRGRPSFLVTTEQFLRHMGLSSLEALPPRPLPTSP